VRKILGRQEVKPHKVRYYLERRDAEFEQKMALRVYREVQVLKKAARIARSRLVVLLLLITALTTSGQFAGFTYLGPLLQLSPMRTADDRDPSSQCLGSRVSSAM
jgi:hypothetical protein